MNRKGGPEGVIDAVEARAPDGFTNIDDVLPFEQRKAIVRGYAGAAGFAQSQVNKAQGGVIFAADLRRNASDCRDSVNLADPGFRPRGIRRCRGPGHSVTRRNRPPRLT